MFRRHGRWVGDPGSLAKGVQWEWVVPFRVDIYQLEVDMTIVDVTGTYSWGQKCPFNLESIQVQVGDLISSWKTFGNLKLWQSELKRVKKLPGETRRRTGKSSDATNGGTRHTDVVYLSGQHILPRPRSTCKGGTGPGRDLYTLIRKNKQISS